MFSRAREVTFEVVDEHPGHVRDLCEVGGPGQRLDHD
jgi:hypothetical protein